MDSGLSRCWGFAFLLAAGFSFTGCGGGGAASGPPPPPPPPSIVVKVTPGIAGVLLGNSQAFNAEVSNTTNTGVTWSVNGVAGGNSSVGTISAAGVYTTPADLPLNPVVQVVATSVADPAKSGTAQLTLSSDIAIAVAPGTANVELGAAQKLQATITSSSHPDTMILWSLSGAACPVGCGNLDAGGNYTAPQVLPFSTAVVVKAQSAADPSKFATANLNITSNFTLQVNGLGTIATTASATIVATLTPIPGSNPSQNLSWSLTGNGCSGSQCGTLATTTTQFDANNVEVSSANYTAPGNAPNPNAVAITVTPTADPSKKAQLTILIQPGLGINLTPQTATAAVNHRVTLTAQITGTTNPNIDWFVNGVAGGNASVGQTCVAGSVPCQVVMSGNALGVEYVAPGATPSLNPVTVVAQSAASPGTRASAQITVISHVIVSVQPASVTLAPLAVQGFTASVLGTSNQSVTWQVLGSGCAVAGACGLVTPVGTYTAPSAAPTPNAIQVLAISADDAAQSGTANVSISTGPNILALHPASVYAGEANGFTLRVDGSGFVPTTNGTGSMMLIGGTARTTSCNTTNECTAAVAPSDTLTAGILSVQLRNPDGSMSNIVLVVVEAFDTTTDVVSLTASSPAATGKDIVVVEPTTAGVSTPGSDVDLDVGALGNFDTVSNSCNLGGNPIRIFRPASGASAADICVFSQSGLDTSMSYSISGTGDVSVLAKQPAGLGIIHLTLQVQANAQPGARTLFIQNTNLDKTAASGVLEVQ